MRQAVPDCRVLGFEAPIEDEDIELPDHNDRHVLAAAIRAGAQTIVTFTLADFPATRFASYNIEAKHPDDVILDAIDLAPGLVASGAD